MLKQLTSSANFHRGLRSTRPGGLLVLLGLVSSLTFPVAAEPAWRRLADGVETREGWVNQKPAQLVHLVRFTPGKAELRHLKAGQPQRAGDWLKASKALAVFNGGYFDNKDKPLGLLFAGGHWIQPKVAGGSAFGGLFTLIGDKPRLYPTFQISDAEYDGLRNHPDLRFMVQCGPRLIADGKLVSGLEKDTFVRRTVIGHDSSGRVVLMASAPHYGMSFAQLQHYLKNQLQLVSALNLDGGSSTQCAIRGASESLGFSSVPFALGIFSR